MDYFGFLQDKLAFIITQDWFDTVTFAILLLNPICLLPQFWILWKKYKGKKNTETVDSDVSMSTFFLFLFISSTAILVSIKSKVLPFLVADSISVIVLAGIVTLLFILKRRRD